MSDTTATAQPTTAPAEQAQPTEAPKPQAPQAAPSDQRDAGKDEPLGEKGLNALRTEREQRERLERELKPLKEQMDALRGIFGDKKDDGQDIVKTLQEQVSAMQRTSLVEAVARRHGITDDGDVAFLRTAPDEASMQRLAERLKGAGTLPASPAPDPSQGTAPMTPEQAEKAEYEHFFPSTTPGK